MASHSKEKARLDIKISLRINHPWCFGIKKLICMADAT